MENMSNKELLKQFEIIAGQLALAESFNQPRKEKQYEKQLLQLEAEVLKRMERWQYDNSRSVEYSKRDEFWGIRKVVEWQTEVRKADSKGKQGYWFWGWQFGSIGRRKRKWTIQQTLAEQTESRSQKGKVTSKIASNHGKNKSIKLLFQVYFEEVKAYEGKKNIYTKCI